MFLLCHPKFIETGTDILALEIHFIFIIVPNPQFTLLVKTILQQIKKYMRKLSFYLLSETIVIIRSGLNLPSNVWFVSIFLFSFHNAY